MVFNVVRFIIKFAGKIKMATEQVVSASMLALSSCVLVADLTCGTLISQRTTGCAAPPPQTLTGPGEAN